MENYELRASLEFRPCCVPVADQLRPLEHIKEGLLLFNMGLILPGQRTITAFPSNLDHHWTALPKGASHMANIFRLCSIRSLYVWRLGHIWPRRNGLLCHEP